MSNIIIVGVGQVGTSVAKNLVAERHNITVIDRDPVKLKELASKYDLRTVTGNAGHPSVLKEAGIADCELLIAVTYWNYPIVMRYFLAIVIVKTRKISPDSV